MKATNDDDSDSLSKDSSSVDITGETSSQEDTRSGRRWSQPAERTTSHKGRKRAAPNKESSKATASTSRRRTVARLPTLTARDDDHYKKTKDELLTFPNMTEELVDFALEEVGPPYAPNMVHKSIRQQRRLVHAAMKESHDISKKFNPEIGMKVTKLVDGYSCHGEIIKDGEIFETNFGDTVERKMLWTVRFKDWEGNFNEDDMDYAELVACLENRRRNWAPMFGRQFQCLELFSGWGVVSQEFADRKWDVFTIGNNEKGDSNAMLKRNLEEVDPATDIPFIPDFIWASPPCFSYSTLAGGRHRNLKNFNVSKESIVQDNLFLHMTKILRFAKHRHPHLIIMIENPVGLLTHMPLMDELVDEFKLVKVEVDYCAFRRMDKKPTHLWTNDRGLAGKLSFFTCKQMCPFYKKGSHPVTVRGGNLPHAAVIPQPLAEIVARYVESKFFMDDLHLNPAADLGS